MSVVEKFYRDLGSFEINISNWHLSEEGITALWGPSGAGKSTIINGLLGFDSKASVRWMFGGIDLAQREPSQRNLGVVTQDAALFPHLSALENILFPVNKKVHSHWQEDLDRLVDQLEIGHILKSPSHQLSGGEQQRVAIARAFIYRPQILLLDEPFSSLDEGVREKVRGMVADLCTKFRCPGLLVTHDRHDVYALASKVTQIECGRILREGSVESFRDWLGAPQST